MAMADRIGRHISADVQAGEAIGAQSSGPMGGTMSNFVDLLFFAGIIVLALFVVGFIISRLYRRASKETAFVRTGFGGQKVVVNGGALVFPVLHEVIQVNMNTLRLEVRRADQQALITKDRMRVDVQAEFYVRVQPLAESIANAAQTLGRRTMEPTALKELIEGKFVDALRAVAAEMTMEELHEQRVNFVQRVQSAVSEDILKNGLELESVSLTGLDQTNREFFNPDNAFDAEGLTQLTRRIEERRKLRNDIEQETQVQISQKNLEAQTTQYLIQRDTEYARLDNEREIAVRLAAQAAEVAREKAEREAEAQQAQAQAQQRVRAAQIAADQAVRLAEQQSQITLAQKSEENSAAAARADEARALAAQAEERVTTARSTEVAERNKSIELIEATKQAQKQSIGIVVAAEAEKKAATDRAEAQQIAAQAESNAERVRAQAKEVTYQVDAEGRRKLNESANTLSPAQIAMNVQMRLIEALPQIIAESVRPMEKIDSIKILSVDGLHQRGVEGAEATDGGGNGASLPDQMVNGALRFRTQAPIMDALMKELGLDGGTLSGLVNGLSIAETPKALGGAGADGSAAGPKAAAAPDGSERPRVERRG